MKNTSAPAWKDSFGIDEDMYLFNIAQKIQLEK
jgi:hypothetical protein